MTVNEFLVAFALGLIVTPVLFVLVARWLFTPKKVEDHRLAVRIISLVTKNGGMSYEFTLKSEKDSETYTRDLTLPNILIAGGLHEALANSLQHRYNEPIRFVDGSPQAKQE